MWTDYLTILYRVDPRFSESIEGQGGGTKKQSMALAVRSGSGIEELGGLGFPALVQRMVKVRGGGYIHLVFWLEYFISLL